jgi:uncharacterized protein
MSTHRMKLNTALNSAFARGNCVVLLGARQCGKTTLARDFAAYIEKHGFDPNAPAVTPVRMFDLEDPLDLAELANARMALSALQGLVVLDEFQRKLDLLPLLRVLLDRTDASTKFLLLGSAAPELLRGASESLAGRVEFIDMGGFSLEEVGESHGARLWQRGGYPRAFLAATDKDSFAWRQNYIRTFFETDLRQMGINIAPAAISRAFAMLAHHHGQIFNANELARSLGIAQTTARHYLDVLTGAFVVRQLQPWFENLSKRQVRSPKFYIRDSGIVHTLLDIRNQSDLQRHIKVGASFEGFVIEQLLSIADARNAYFWATQAGAELDLLLHHNGKRIGVEIKHSDAPAASKSMHIAQQDLKLDELWLIYRGERQFAVNDFIQAMSVGQAMKHLALSA